MQGDKATAAHTPSAGAFALGLALGRQRRSAHHRPLLPLLPFLALPRRGQWCSSGSVWSDTALALVWLIRGWLGWWFLRSACTSADQSELARPAPAAASGVLANRGWSLRPNTFQLTTLPDRPAWVTHRCNGAKAQQKAVFEFCFLAALRPGVPYLKDSASNPPMLATLALTLRRATPATHTSATTASVYTPIQHGLGTLLDRVGAVSRPAAGVGIPALGIDGARHAAQAVHVNGTVFRHTTERPVRMEWTTGPSRLMQHAPAAIPAGYRQEPGQTRAVRQSVAHSGSTADGSQRRFRFAPPLESGTQPRHAGIAPTRPFEHPHGQFRDVGMPVSGEQRRRVTAQPVFSPILAVWQKGTLFGLRWSLHQRYGRLNLVQQHILSAARLSLARPTWRSPDATVRFFVAAPAGQQLPLRFHQEGKGQQREEHVFSDALTSHALFLPGARGKAAEITTRLSAPNPAHPDTHAPLPERQPTGIAHPEIAVPPGRYGRSTQDGASFRFREGGNAGHAAPGDFPGRMHWLHSIAGVTHLVERTVVEEVRRYLADQPVAPPVQHGMNTHSLEQHITSDAVVRVLLHKIQTLVQEERFRAGLVR